MYRIAARFDRPDTEGLSVYEWFTGRDYPGQCLDNEFDTAEEAEAAAQAAYKGPDESGLGVVWTIKPA